VCHLRKDPPPRDLILNDLRKKVLLMQKMGQKDGGGMVAPGKALFRMTKLL